MVEDDDGEVLRNFTIPSQGRGQTTAPSHFKGAFGFASQSQALQRNSSNDDGLRFSRKGSGGTMNTTDLIRALQQLDPKQHSNRQTTFCSQVNIIPPTPAAGYTPNTISLNTSHIVVAEELRSLQTNIDTDSFRENSRKVDHETKGKSKASLSGLSSGYVATQPPNTDGVTKPFVPTGGLTSHMAFQGMGITQVQSCHKRSVNHLTTKALGENPEWNETAVEKRRRLAALSSSSAVFEDSGDGSEDDAEMPRKPKTHYALAPVAAVSTSSRQHRVSWGDEVEAGLTRKRRLGP
jgi:hypothetical protein